MAALQHALQLAAGALEAALAAGVVTEGTVVTFTEKSAHLGRHTVGDILDACDAALGREVEPAEPIPAPARAAGYTGDQCDTCGGAHMRRNGSCLVCDDCGTTTGCS